jgi:cytochrome subunit of sulfide dehydrogenase
VSEPPSPTWSSGLGRPSPALRERVPSAARRVRAWPLIATLMLMTMVSGSASAVQPPAGATSCSGCHATSAKVETPVPPVRGRDPAEIVTAMQAFRSGERPSTVMGRIAKGFSDEEIRAIAGWLATER